MLPIDLQTLYTQLDKIGKTQVHQQLAAQNALEAQMAANRLKSEQKLKKVQELETGDGTVGIVHERKEGENPDAGDTQTGAGPADENNGMDETVAEKLVIKDPALGTHIDISG